MRVEFENCEWKIYVQEKKKHSGSIPRNACVACETYIAKRDSEECMCRLRNIAMRDYQESVTTRQMDGQTDAGQSDPYVPLCFAGDTTSQ